MTTENTSYRRTLTMADAWRRRVETESPLIRIIGAATSGAEEISSLGTFLRWSGQFVAQAVTMPMTPAEREAAPSGIVRTLTSYALILPGLGADWLRTFFEAQRVERSADPTDKRTGLALIPAAGLPDIRFVVDISLCPALAGKPSETGYEYRMRVAKADSRHDPMGDLLRDLGMFADSYQPQLLRDAGAVPFSLGTEAQPALPLAGPSEGVPEAAEVPEMQEAQPTRMASGGRRRGPVTVG